MKLKLEINYFLYYVVYFEYILCINFVLSCSLLSVKKIHPHPPTMRMKGGLYRGWKWGGNRMDFWMNSQLKIRILQDKVREMWFVLILNGTLKGAVRFGSKDARRRRWGHVGWFSDVLYTGQKKRGENDVVRVHIASLLLFEKERSQSIKGIGLGFFWHWA